MYQLIVCWFKDLLFNFARCYQLTFRLDLEKQEANKNENIEIQSEKNTHTQN